MKTKFIYVAIIVMGNLFAMPSTWAVSSFNYNGGGWFDQFNNGNGYSVANNTFYGVDAFLDEELRYYDAYIGFNISSLLGASISSASLMIGGGVADGAIEGQVQNFTAVYFNSSPSYITIENAHIIGSFSTTGQPIEISLNAQAILSFLTENTHAQSGNIYFGFINKTNSPQDLSVFDYQGLNLDYTGIWSQRSISRFIPTLSVNTDSHAIPEPTTIALMGLGIVVGMAGYRRKPTSFTGT